MRLIVFISIILLSQNCFAQKKYSEINFTATELKDTIQNRKDGICKLKVTNKSKYPIVISDYNFIYYEVVFMENGKKTTITKGNTFKNLGIQIFSPESFKAIGYNHSEDFTCHLSDGNFRKAGNYQVRFVLDLGRLNRCLKEIKTNWINIYVKTIDFGLID